jgi:peptide deformylase
MFQIRSLVLFAFWSAAWIFSCLQQPTAVEALSSLTTTTRRNFVESTAKTIPFLISLPFPSDADESLQSPPTIIHPFRYSDTWTGTQLNLMTLEEAALSSSSSGKNKSKQYWDMGRWPDPILRRPATDVDPKYFNTPILLQACDTLTKVAKQEGAVGLAAQQCGVDARIVYIEQPTNKCLINPIIVERSQEYEMQVWNEQCLVLPPSFEATVLRDAWIQVQYFTPEGTLESMRLKGEPARCLQHEMDHDRGILTLDHIGLEEMENDIMREIEQSGHQQRQLLAYDRYITDPMKAIA